MGLSELPSRSFPEMLCREIDRVPGGWVWWAGLTGITFLVANLSALVNDASPGGLAGALDLGYVLLAVATVGCPVAVGKFFVTEYFDRRGPRSV